ncbi:hypothetical protein [Schleiferilactobacillus harbinensis]|uniref:Uncharacterized protein n=1 Tax=Schleiferilactobacillus harbinensis TaxID=304207 RepID=A0A5P8M436_9LACO|nr:hypothetical protein [Schleiferilactobacillus harbinensis]QFR23229.1 hypothetical protein D1010_07355 [Schleiferilactobacillus harbinensis]
MDAWDEQIEDFDYAERQALVELGILPEEFERASSKRMNEILQARAPKDRPMDAFKYMQSQRNTPRKKGGK